MSENEAPAAMLEGVNLICHATGSFGLAVAARNSIRTLDDAGVPLAVIDVDSLDGRSGRDTTYAERLGATAPYAVNLFHLNPPEIIRLIQERPAWLDLRKLNACVPFWELPRTPAAWTPLLQGMDVVLAPTRFVRDAVLAGAPGVECRHYPQATYRTEGVAPDRERWGLPAAATVFLVAFDITSDPDRKNPYAALRAFQQAELTADQAHLVIKLSNTDSSRRLRSSAEELMATVETDPRITVINEYLSYEDMLSLTASCDALIALHRSEGLGLNLLEAMSLGKAVIGTGWSGNMDFMTEHNSVPIPFALVPVVSGHPAYRPSVIGEGQVWAEPDVKQAAAAIREVADSAELRQNLGAVGLQDMRSLRESPIRSQTVIDLFDSAPSILTSTEHCSRTLMLTELQHIALTTRARRTVVRVLRALGLKR